jgi:hypothetical protein
VDDATIAAIGPLPEGKGILGRLIVDPQPLRLTDLAGASRLVRVPGESSADAFVPRGAHPHPR